MIITSMDNDRVKKYIKLKQKKYRDKYNEFIVEGEHLVDEAIKMNIAKEIIAEAHEKVDFDGNTISLSYDIMKKISTMDTPPKIMALCDKLVPKKKIGDRILILDNIQDPGNLGTIIRSAVAFNVDTVILSSDTVDLYNPKVIRSTQGMLFKVNIIIGNLNEYIEKIKALGIPIYTTNVVNGVDVRTLTKEEKSRYALIVGNEGNGVSPEIDKLASKKLYIKMNSKTESLNVGVASSILLYELGDVDE